MRLPATSPRRDGLLLNGYCADCHGSTCQLIVSVLPGGLIRLAYHGTASHSVVLTREQYAALTALVVTNSMESSRGDRFDDKSD